MIGIYIIIGILVMGMTWVMYQLKVAPKGYQDKNGFHFGEKHGSNNRKRDVLGNPVNSVRAGNKKKIQKRGKVNGTS